MKTSEKRRAGWNDVAQKYDSYFSARFKPWIQEAVAGIDSPDLVGGAIVDVCCGSGSAFPMLESRFPQRELIGIDFSEAMLDVAARRTGSKTTLICTDASDITFIEQAAGIISSFGLQQLDPLPTLFNWVSILAKGGRFGIVLWEPPFDEQDPFEIGRYIISQKLPTTAPIRTLPCSTELRGLLGERGIQVEVDTQRAHSIHHASRGVFWDAMVKWGPWRVHTLTQGEAFMKEVQKEFNLFCPPNILIHEPKARLIIGTKFL